MSDIVTTFETVAKAQEIHFLHALKNIQALTQRKNAIWPILYLDAPKVRKPELDAQNALSNSWEIFFTILDQDKKGNSEEQSQAVVDSCRGFMNIFIKALMDEVDSHERKVVKSMTALIENELRSWSAGVLSGVTMSATITFIDPTFNCTT
tara:strand:- start:12471 stop:12923 length:453 start_codon:yes stop_codon:yes gene_type:complete